MTIRINQRIILVALGLFFLNRIFTFEIITISPLVNELFVLISEAITIYELFAYFYSMAANGKMNTKEDAVFILILLYFTYLLFNSILQGTNIRRIFMTAYPVLGTVAFLYNNSKRDYAILIDGIALYFKFTIIATFLDALFVRHVLSQHTDTFLVGGRNQMAITLVMALSFIAIDFTKEESLLGRETIKEILGTLTYLILIVFLGFVSGSSTVIVSVAVMVVLFALSKKDKFINPKVFFFGYSLLWVGLVILRLHRLVANLILNILHKDLTLSHRTLIWDAALELIREKPIFGYGNPDSYNVFSVNHDFTGGNNNVWTSLSGHNQILQILYYGGIVMLLFFIIIYFVSTKEANKKLTSYLFFIAVIVISITWLSEVPGEYGMFFALTMCFLSQKYTIRSKEMNLNGKSSVYNCTDI